MRGPVVLEPINPRQTTAMSNSYEAIVNARELLNAEYIAVNAKLRKYQDDLQPKARLKLDH